MSEWISVKDRLPKPGERILLSSKKFVGEGWINGTLNKFFRYDGIEWSKIFIENITHWMPLPEPPEEQL